MPSPSTPFQNLQNAWLKAFGIPATFYPTSLNNPSNPVAAGVDITGVIVPPPMLEELAPAGGAAVIYFKVQWWNISPNPVTGDIIEINGTYYDVGNVAVDRIDGAILKMRVNSNVA